MLGSGAADYEEALRAAQAAYPASVRSHVGFSVPLSHKILAGADILLMPSRFEPCGLNQLYAMRWGRGGLWVCVWGLLIRAAGRNAVGGQKGRRVWVEVPWGGFAVLLLACRVAITSCTP